ncbi:MAG: hypothetical protein JWR38_5861 [Mucilaginibacter sp.]|nr:hypothetical protein [Mucilaginibacter sp.]
MIIVLKTICLFSAFKLRANWLSGYLVLFNVFLTDYCTLLRWLNQIKTIFNTYE